MAPKSKKSEYPAFTNFTIKVTEHSWARTVHSLLNSVEGVTNFKTEGDGKINISGYVEPAILLKRMRKLGKSAHLEHWQYGECSNNMYVKKQEPAANKNVNVNGSNGFCLYPQYPGYGRYNGYNGNNGYPSYRNNYDCNRIESAGNATGTGYGNNYDCNRIESAGNATGYGNNYDCNRIQSAGNATGYGKNYDCNRIEFAGNATRYGNNYDYNRIQCAGNASDCNEQHTEKPKTPEKSASSSSKVFKKLSSVTSCFHGGNCVA